MRRRRVVAGAVLCAALLAGCGSTAQEPEGLGTPAETAGPAEPVETPEPTDEPDTDPDDPPEPAATFTQPYLPEESVVELRDEVPIDVPDDLDDDELAVVRAYGRYYAVNELQLKGVPFDDLDVEAVATGERLAAMRAYAEESEELEQVVVGPPVEIHLAGVDVEGDRATVLTCLDPGESIRVTGGVPNLLTELVEYETELVAEDGTWKVARTVTPDDESPCDEAD